MSILMVQVPAANAIDKLSLIVVNILRAFPLVSSFPSLPPSLPTVPTPISL